MAETVSATLVTYNSRKYIGRCLEVLLQQEDVSLEVVVVDNASNDGTLDVLATFGARIRVIRNTRNVGFAAAQNQAIAASCGAWVLTLNPDVLLTPGFISRLVAAGRLDARAGTVCGKLLSIGAGFVPPEKPLLDSTGIYFTPAMRHFDRGWHEPDDGRYNRMEYVFGASAAAALYRREMIRDVSHPGGEFFDPDFFAYREDADVAWRAQLLGWRCIYTPLAVGYHVRTAAPENRRDLPAAVNMHSVKNRFLMRIKNATPGVWRRCWLPMLARDLVVVGGCLVCEQTSLAAFWHVVKLFPGALRRRRAIMQRRRANDTALAHWFSSRPEDAGQAMRPARPYAAAGET